MSRILQTLRTGVARNRAAVAILAVYVILATAYGLADPLFEAPDELLHYEFMQYDPPTDTRLALEGAGDYVRLESVVEVR